ncbi:MAG: DsrE family protein [Sphingomonadaceae bacterium]
MPGLLLIVAGADGERLAAAIELAAAVAALGRPVELLLRGTAVTALGQPEMKQGFGLLSELGAGLWACQTAMAAHGLTAADLPRHVEATGLVALMKDRADWQLAVV